MLNSINRRMKRKPFDLIDLITNNLKRAIPVCPFWVILMVIGLPLFVQGQVTVFSDDFSTNTNAVWITDGMMGASAWSVLRSGDDWGARRNVSPEQLEMTNDVSGTENAEGWVFAMTATTSFISPYDTILGQGGVVTWTFNMRQIRLDPSGFDSGLYGVAFILAGQTATSSTNGSGYAVVLGQTGEDPVRLVSYTSGIMGDATLTDIISSNTAGLTDLGNEYLSIRVNYNPCLNHQWELFVRNDGITEFADPLSGTLTSQGIANNSAFTGVALPMMAAYWQGNTASEQTAFFDNVTVSVTDTPVAEAGSYPPACMDDPDITLMGTPSGGIWSGTGITGNNFDPGVGSQILTYTFTDLNGCSDADQATIIVNACLAPPEMHWEVLEAGVQIGSCTSTSDCDNDIICYALVYTPNMTGTVTSYTAGFIVDCDGGVSNPVLTNASCVMNSATFVIDSCQEFGVVQMASSGNTGSLPIMQGVPDTLHQVCFTIPEGEIDIVLDLIGLSVSIDSANGGAPVDEFPSYATYTIDSTLDCSVLPLRFLHFTATRYAELQSQLDWTTADEINTSYFEIQRSNDGGASFYIIGSVEASRTPQTINKYLFIDEDAKPGNNYYRLKQFDRDGQFQFSPVRNVFFGTGAFIARVWPNPVADQLFINIQHASSAGTIQLIDIVGKEIISLNFENGFSDNRLFVDSLEPGVYTLLVKSGSEQYEQKIVVIN